MMSSTNARERRLAWIAWIAVCVIWGTTYLFIRISLETIPPMLMGGLRWLIAGGLLAAYMLARGEGLPGRSGLRNAVVIVARHVRLYERACHSVTESARSNDELVTATVAISR